MEADERGYLFDGAAVCFEDRIWSLTLTWVKTEKFIYTHVPASV